MKALSGLAPPPARVHVRAASRTTRLRDQCRRPDNARRGQAAPPLTAVAWALVSCSRVLAGE
eukprot:1944059-Prymnesium_polylepis.1